MKLKTLIKISRPRFWLYSAGTFWVGVAAGMDQISDLQNPMLYIYLLYFLIPMNIFIYGINDLGDGDTDPHNEKKTDKEHLLQQSETKHLKLWVVGSILLGIILAIFAPNNLTRVWWAISLLLAFWYSTPPLRFKARPFIDAISNVHYAVIGFLAYSFLTGEMPPPWAIGAAWFWTAAMHIFSAIPDIESDSKAGLNTTAIFFGARKAEILCFLLWFIAAWLTVISIQGPIAWLAFIYPILSLWFLITKSSIPKVYWLYPYVNAILGLLLFWTLIWPKF